MIQAYILIQAEIGKSHEIARALAPVPGVTRVDVVTGPYDVILLVDTDTTAALGDLIYKKVQGMNGVTRTLTCSIFDPTPDGQGRPGGNAT